MDQHVVTADTDEHDADPAALSWFTPVLSSRLRVSRATHAAPDTRCTLDSIVNELLAEGGASDFRSGTDDLLRRPVL